MPILNGRKGDPPEGLHYASLRSGPSHCLLRPRYRGNLYPTGPSPYPCAGVHKPPEMPSLSTSPISIKI